MKKVFFIISFLSLVFLLHSEEKGKLVKSSRIINIGSYRVSIDKYGRIKKIEREDKIIIKSCYLAGYPIGSGRLWHGGNPPESFDDEISPTEIFYEKDKIILKRRGILRNQKYPEILKYKYEANLYNNGKINLYYEIEHLVGLKWKAYGPWLPCNIVLVPGKGWVAERKDETVKAGIIPSIYSKENIKEFPSISNGAKLRIGTDFGELEIVAGKNNCLRGYTTKDGKTAVINTRNYFPGDPQIKKGTRQNLNLIIKLPKNAE